MSHVADGATTRRERILDLLAYIQQTQPKGCPVVQAQQHMSLAHGLTFRKTEEYIYELRLAGVLIINNGLLIIRNDQFKRMMELVAPERDPETGQPRALWGIEDLDVAPPKRRNQQGNKT